MAAYSLANLISYCTTQANMIALAGFLFDTVLSGGGWVKTADTGQQASASWPAGSGTNTSGGYQIWRMADTLQGTYPVFIKFELGSGSVAGVPAMWITIGTGSNGSGTITGTVLARTQFGNYSNYTTSGFPCLGSATTSRFNILLMYNVSTSNTCFYLGIERSKDGTGADTGLGLIVQSLAGTTSPQQHWHQYIPFSGTVVAAKQLALAMLDPAYVNTGLSDGSGNVYAVPIAPWSLQGARNYGIQLYGYYSTDLPSLNSLTMSVRGVNHTYFTMGLLSSWANPFISGGTNLYPMMLWE